MFRPTKRWILGAITGLGFTGAKMPTPAAAGSAELEAYRAKMWAAFPYKIITVPGDKALEEWTRLQNEGGWPVIVGGDEALLNIADQFFVNTESIAGATDHVETVQSILADANQIRFPEDLEKWEGAYAEEDLTAEVGEWPTHSFKEELVPTVAADLHTGKFLTQVHIVLVPAKASWEVPAYLRWGGWNACPPPAYNVAALRSWHERFGAELIGMDGDTLDLRVPKTLTDRDQALALAREMYRYCPDIVDQGTGDLASLAKALMDIKWWFFWWD